MGPALALISTLALALAPACGGADRADALSEPGATDASAATDDRSREAATDATAVSFDGPVADPGDASTRGEASVSPSPDAAPFAGDAADARAAVVYPPEPCASTRYGVSCDPACQPWGCNDFTCGERSFGTPRIYPDYLGPFPWRLRTPPAARGVTCENRCGPFTVATGIFRFEINVPVETALTVRVGAPWRVLVNPRYALCVSESEAAATTTSCVSRPITKTVFIVFTTERNAPARDVVIERATAEGCGRTGT